MAYIKVTEENHRGKKYIYTQRHCLHIPRKHKVLENHPVFIFYT